MSWTYYTPKGAAIKILSGTKSGPPTGGFILILDATFAVALEVVTVRIF